MDIQKEFTTGEKVKLNKRSKKRVNEHLKAARAFEQTIEDLSKSKQERLAKMCNIIFDSNPELKNYNMTMKQKGGKFIEIIIDSRK